MNTEKYCVVYKFKHIDETHSLYAHDLFTAEQALKLLSINKSKLEVVDIKVYSGTYNFYRSIIR